MDDCDTFRKELATKYSRYGHALWEPDPGALYDTVEVGDVGYIRDGKFHRLFNVFLPEDHPSHRNNGVPEYHEELQLNMEDHIDKGRDTCRIFCSRHVTQVSRGLQYDASRPDDSAQVTYSCPGRRGALLSLPLLTQREDTVARGEFGRWIVKHIRVWFAFANNNLGLGINNMEEIILVTGRHLARSWVYATFDDRQPGAQVSFAVQVSGESSVHLEWRDACGGELKLGPIGQDLRENQCVFVRGFRVSRVMNLWPRKFRGLAGPASDTGEDGPEPESDASLELISIPADTNYQDPLHAMLERITEQSPNCDLALVHDDDLACLDDAPDTLAEPLLDFSPEIQRVRWDVLSRDEIGSGTEVTSAEVAMLSQDAFKKMRTDIDSFVTDLENDDSPDAVPDDFQGKAQNFEELLRRDSGTPKISLDPTAKILPEFSTSPESTPVSNASQYSEDSDEGEDEDEGNTPGGPMERNASNEDLSVPDLLQKGTTMFKVSARQEKDVLLRLDPGKHQIVWDSKRRKASIPIEKIEKLKSASEARYYRESLFFTEFCENRWLTIVYNINGRRREWHAIAPSVDIFQMWDSTLHKLYDAVS